MNIESLNNFSEGAADFINPNACEARVEVEINSRIRETTISGTEIVCRKCDLIQGFESVGTEERISQEVRRKVANTIRERCLKVGGRGEEVPVELLPQATLRS